VSTKQKTPPKPKATKTAARKPVTYTRELGLKLAEEVAMRRPLAEVCAEPGMPSERTVYTWRRTHPEFAADYEEARKWLFSLAACVSRRAGTSILCCGLR
jgi:hypothetical protein